MQQHQTDQTVATSSTARASSRSSRSSRWSRSSWDVAVVAGLAVFAAAVAMVFPEGATLRLMLTLPVLLVAPGYLLIQAFNVPPSRPAIRGVQGLLSLGISPAVVGLLALATALIPGGFGSTAIIAFVTIWCLLMAGVAYLRRVSQPARVASTAATAQTMNR